MSAWVSVAKEAYIVDEQMETETQTLGCVRWTEFERRHFPGDRIGNTVAIALCHREREHLSVDGMDRATDVVN